MPRTAFVFADAFKSAVADAMLGSDVLDKCLAGSPDGDGVIILIENELLAARKSLPSATALLQFFDAGKYDVVGNHLRRGVTYARAVELWNLGKAYGLPSEVNGTKAA